MEITATAGFYLAYRRVCTIIVSPAGGWLADKYGINTVYLLSTALTISGLFLIASGLVIPGIIVTFTFYSLSNAMSPGNASAGAQNHIKAVATNSTWTDTGAAAGTLIGGFVLYSVHPTIIFFIGSFVLVTALVVYSKSTNFLFKHSVRWK